MGNLDSLTNREPEQNDYIYITSSDGSEDGKVQFKNITSLPERSTTVNFNSSMSAGTINSMINDLNHYIPSSHNLTLQFADGTYTLNDDIFINDFYGGGILRIYGNTSETNATTLHTTQSVHLNFTSSGNHGLYIFGNTIPHIDVFNLKITTDDGLSSLIIQRGAHARVFYNYFVSNGKTSTNTRSLYVIDETSVEAKHNYINGSYYGFEARNGAHIYSNTNDDTGTQPTYGLRAVGACTIGKNSTQPAGSTSNELSQNGSIIR